MRVVKLAKNVISGGDYVIWDLAAAVAGGVGGYYVAKKWPGGVVKYIGAITGANLALLIMQGIRGYTGSGINFAYQGAEGFPKLALRPLNTNKVKESIGFAYQGADGFPQLV